MFGNVLGCAEDGQDIVFKDDATLEINHVRVADRAVGRQFDRRTLDEITGGHDDLIGIARHIVGNGCDVGVDRREGLDTLAEETHVLFVFQVNGLDQVDARILDGR